MREKVRHCQIRRALMNGVVCLLLMPWVSSIAVADAAGTTAPATPATQTAPKANLTWAIDPPASTWYLGPNQNKGAEFVLTVSAGTNITALRVTHSTIVDSDTGRGVSLSAEHFHICLPNAAVKDCAETLKAKLEEVKKQLNDAAGGTDKPQQSADKIALWLVVDEDIVPNGTFTGNLFLDTEPLTDTKTLQLTIQHTTGTAKIWGVVVILVGVILAWVITVLARSRINRDQALLPIAVLQQKLRAIRQDLDGISNVLQDCVTDTQKALAAVIADLQTDNLDNLQLLPPSLPAISPSTTQPGALQAFLQARSQVVDNLGVIVTGIKAAGVLAVPSLPDDRLETLRTLVSHIDQLSASLPQISDGLRTKIQVLFDNWNSGPPGASSRCAGTASGDA